MVQKGMKRKHSPKVNSRKRKHIIDIDYARNELNLSRKQKKNQNFSDMNRSYNQTGGNIENSNDNNQSGGILFPVIVGSSGLGNPSTAPPPSIPPTIQQQPEGQPPYPGQTPYQDQDQTQGPSEGDGDID